MTSQKEVPTQFGPFWFKSQKEAAEYFGVTVHTILRAVNSPDPISYLGVALIRTLRKNQSPQVTYSLVIDYFQQQLDYTNKQAEEKFPTPECIATQGNSYVPGTSDNF